MHEQHVHLENRESCNYVLAKGAQKGFNKMNAPIAVYLVIQKKVLSFYHFSAIPDSVYRFFSTTSRFLKKLILLILYVDTTKYPG